MSFSTEVKNELKSKMVTPKAKHCQIAEEKALELFSGDGIHARCDGLIVQKSCCRRNFIKVAFLEKGTVNDPSKGYHLEIACRGNSQATQLCELLAKDGINAKVIERNKRMSVYVKEAEQISDMLALMGAHKAVLSMENERILHQVRGDINRRVNCETANINKTVNASVRQIEAINYIQAHDGLHNLPDNLREMASVRLEWPESSLSDLGQYLDPPVGKSGVNHRLRKIVEIAEKMGFED